MKKVIFYLFLILGIMIYAGCGKDDLVKNGYIDSAGIQLRHSGDIVYSPSDTITETILGEKAPCNPYTVEIVTKAWNNLYPDDAVSELPASHRYVKFIPMTEEDIYRLYNDSVLTVWDYPLDYEMINIGDYYKQPGKGDNDMPDLYSVVGKDYNIDFGIGYEELEQLIVVPYNTMLSAETYRLCNISHIVITPPGDSVPPDQPPPYYPPIDYEDCNPGCANYPCCFLEMIDCDTPLNPFLEEFCNDYDPPCYPDDPNWPDCLNPDGGGGNPSTNSCGCPTFADKRKPAGCVQVQDPTGAGFTGVNNAKIIIKNTPCYDCPDINLFSLLWTKTTHTDENGCWKIDKSCRGKIWMWVQFKNEDAYIRGHQGSNILRYLIPVTDYVGGISGPDFSNIQVKYNRWTTEGTQTQRYWCAARTINHVSEMHDMCSQENINVPPHLDIYLASDVTGSAWMAHYGGVSDIIYAQLLDAFFPEASTSILPDIFLDRNENVDDYRGVVYHEMSHASHFTHVGAEWWQHNTQFQFSHGGHGDNAAQNDPDAGYVAVSESWADHLGDLFNEGNPDMSFINERLFWEANGWIPEGLHYDLYDDVSSNERWFINDNISGFTNERIFDVLDANVTSIPEMRARLWNKYSTASGVSANLTDYNILYSSYGY